MATKKDWKDTGKGIGSAFKDFGKACVRSVARTSKKVSDSIEGKTPTEEEKNSSVYSDGTWKKVGKNFGKAFSKFGETLGETIIPDVERDKKENNTFDAEYTEKQ